jgi:SAM-dependent methyltransferase
VRRSPPWVGLPMKVQTRLVVASAHMLLTELVLIRWAGANVVHLSYLANFVLLGSFLGIGLGFLRASRARDGTAWSPVLLAGLIIVVLAFPVTVDQRSADVVYFSSVKPDGPPPWLALPVIFVAVAAIMAGPGEAVGRCFKQLPALTAYRLDLIGSLAGIGGFTLLSFLRAPSVVWGIVVVAGYLILLWPKLPRLTAIACTVIVGLLAMETLTAGVSWSPYYKVRTRENGEQTQISVNGIPHQDIKPVTRLLEGDARYTLPYDRLAGVQPRRVLIIGAGNGNDVALALRRGAQQVDAVEIDPRLLEIGRTDHPNQPYSDQRVRTIVDDGRAFLERNKTRYDLVLFALPDSLTLVTGAASIRLESYLFTAEAMRAAREHLAPGGGFAMYNNYREQWIVDRLVRTLSDAYGHPPCLDSFGRTGQLAVLSVALNPSDQRCATTPDVTSPAVAGERPATDDHPFLYLRERGIPSFYLLVLAGILIASLFAVRVVAGPLRRMRPYADLFGMGVAFLLLETKYVAGFALLFGTTWVVNAIVFAGVLLAVLLAVEVTRRVPTPRLPVLYALLAAALLLAWLIPPTWLLTLPVPIRLVTAIAVAFAPIFLANVIFAKRLAAVGDSTTAFGANLLGAMVGGCLEYVALIVGYHALLLVAGLVYAASFAAIPREARVSVSG